MTDRQSGADRVCPEREAKIQASLSHLDAETRAAQDKLKTIFGSNYFTEEEVRRSLSSLPKEGADAFVELWEEGEIVPRCRNEYGELTWVATSAGSRSK